MPYRDDQTRTRKYDLSVIADNVRAKFAALKPLMLDLQEARQAEIVEFETRIRNILDDNGIVGVNRVPYLNFGRVLYGHMGHQRGVALQKAATAEKAKYVSLGLDATKLDEIVYAVIGAAVY